MDIEEITPASYTLTPSSEGKTSHTPSTWPNTHIRSNPQDIDSPMISEFNIGDQMQCLTKLMRCHSLDEKENTNDDKRIHYQQQLSHQHATDRFIPLRRDTSWDIVEQMHIHQNNQVRGKEMVEEKLTLDEMYKSVLLEKGNGNNKVLLFDNSRSTYKPIPKLIPPTSLPLPLTLTRHSKSTPGSTSSYRKINKTPFKVLDAPNLQDDFYLNLLQWSSQNILSVALDSCLYFWNANNNRVQRFCQLAPDNISSIGWNNTGSQICIGNSKGTIQIWDAHRSTKVNEYHGHSSRVSSVAWSNSNLLASGSRDRAIHLRDLRDKPTTGLYSKYEGHTQEVCGLKWSFDGNLLASGGNDNKLFIWSAHSSTPISKFNQHCAAVKGIAWSPHNHGVLASGGGSADKTIKFWNILDNTLLDSIDTGSQVCNLLFSKNTKQIVSTHGYSNNQIIIWKYPTLQKLSTLTGHSSRVLFLAMNPSGQTIVTGAGDETLRFWNVFPGQSKKEARSQLSSMMELR